MHIIGCVLTFLPLAVFYVHRFGSARGLLGRQIELARQNLSAFEADIYKNILSIIVLRFHTEDAEKAVEDLQKYEQVERFARSDECMCANELIAAYEEGE